MNSPAKSKINALAFAIPIATLALMAFDAPDKVKAEVLTLVTLTVPPMINVCRTWFTGRNALKEWWNK